MELRKHYKMYKSGKNWCYMVLATVMTVVGLSMVPHHTVLADSSSQVSTQQYNNNENSNATVDTDQSNNETSNTDQQVTNYNQENSQSSDQTTNHADSMVTLDLNTNDQTDSNSSQVMAELADSKASIKTVNASIQNGWVTNSNGQKTYYRNGQLDSGREYVSLPSMTDSSQTNYYLLQDGVAQSGLQAWAGHYYYFDPTTYLVQRNTYVDPDGNDTGYLLDKDGIALNGIQKWQGIYYAFDYNNYRLVKNQKFSEWGNTYQIDDHGQVVRGLYKESNGDVYYYDPTTYLAVKNDYVVPEGTKNGYLFGNDGKALTGVQHWVDTYYYFDPTSKQLVRHNYVQSQWGMWYMFGDDGRIITGPYQWQGAIYFFDPTTYLRVDNDYRVPAGSDRGYLLGSDGRALSGVQKWQGNYYYFDPSTYLLVKNNYVQSQWGLWYMFGNDGRIVTGPYQWAGATYYFDENTYLRVDNDYRVPAGSSVGYLLGSDGRAKTGFQQWQGNTYFFNPSSGQLVVNSNFYYNGHLYYANQYGLISENASFTNAINQYIVNNHINHANITYDYVIPTNITGSYSGTSNGLPNMVIVHETANSNDSLWGEVNYEKNNYNNAFVHAFIDGNNIVQISTTDHESWGAGYPANGRAVQFEQVEVHSTSDFAKELANAAYYTAYNMHKYGMVPSLGGTLYSHHMISQNFGGTDHTDPDAYWSRNASQFGTTYTMSDFYQLVNAFYAGI